MINMAQINNSWTHLNFDGVDEYLYADNTSWGNSAKTGGKAMAFWFKLDALIPSNGAVGAVGLGGTTVVASAAFIDFGFRRNSTFFGSNTRLDRIIRPTDGGDSSYVNGSTALATGVQYMVVFQTTGSATQIYLGSGGSIALETLSTTVGTDSGQWFGDVTVSGTRRNSIGALYLGGGATNFQNGKMDNVMIFNDDLTSTEITTLYNGGKPINPVSVGLGSKLEGFYQMGETEDSISTFKSMVTAGNNMTSVNMEAADIISTNHY